MASLYKQNGSSFWWIKFRDPNSNIIKRQSTGFRIGIGDETRKARELQATKTLAERTLSGNTRQEAWDIWTTTWLEKTQNKSSSCKRRYLSSWKTIRIYLDEKKVALPRQLTRKHCMDYPEWRQHPNHPLGKYQAGRNTALLELRILGVIMSEAIARGYANHNPCYKLGLKKDDRRLYPELTDEELERIQIQIELEPEPMRTCFRNSFLIARYHGVRLNETRLNPMTDVEISTDTNGAKLGLIRFKQKGNRHTTKPLHPNLIPFFEELQSRAVTETYPELGHGWSNKWFRLLKRAGLKGKNGTNPNACFHSLRVTVASRMARNNVSMRKAMEYLTHASTTVHAAYVRWRPEDVAECHKAVI